MAFFLISKLEVFKAVLVGRWNCWWTGVSLIQFYLFARMYKVLLLWKQEESNKPGSFFIHNTKALSASKLSQLFLSNTWFWSRLYRSFLLLPWDLSVSLPHVHTHSKKVPSKAFCASMIQILQPLCMWVVVRVPGLWFGGCHYVSYLLTYLL